MEDKLLIYIALKACEDYFSYDKGGRKFEKYLTSSVNYK